MLAFIAKQSPRKKDRMSKQSPTATSPGPQTAVCTICSRNYLHYAVTLMNSVRRIHPGWRRVLLLVDDPEPLPGPNVVFSEVVSIDDIGLPEPQKFKFRYDILELNTACKPWLISRLLENRGIDRVLYLDPDTRVYSPLSEVESGMDRGKSIVVTPHLTRPIDDDRHPGEINIIRAGSWNLGFIAVRRSKSTGQFLRWWKSKLEFECVHDVSNGLFVDQKWMDLVPGLFGGVYILRHEGYNVAYWNIGQRHIFDSGGEYEANGKPLRFAHFSGIDIECPEQLSIHQNRFKLRDLVPAARDMYEEYRAELKNNGYERFRHRPYVFDQFANGWPIPRIVRKLYRECEGFQTALGKDPLVSGGDFLNQSWDEIAAPLVTQFMALMWQSRVSLQRNFPDIKSRDRNRFCSYFILAARKQMDLTHHYTEPVKVSLESRNSAGTAPPVHQLDSVVQHGLNIVGYLRHELGVGQSARQCCAAAASQSALNWTAVDFSIGCFSRAEDYSCARYIHHNNPYTFNLFHVNANKIETAYNYFGHSFFEGKYNIGYWHWELSVFPDIWVEYFKYLDEIWGPSRFVQNAIEDKSPIPVTRIPHGIEFPVNGALDPARYSIPTGKFLYR
jgi:hypothetical protein